MNAPVRIVMVSGSLRAGSTNTAVLQTARAVAPDGVTAVIYGGMGALPLSIPMTIERVIRCTPPLPVGLRRARPMLMSLRKVLGYVGANVVEDACVRIPVARQAVAPDGT